MHLVGYLHKDYHDAWSLEHKVRSVNSSPEQQRLSQSLTDRQKLINELVDVIVFNKYFSLLKGGHAYCSHLSQLRH